MLQLQTLRKHGRRSRVSRNGFTWRISVYIPFHPTFSFLFRRQDVTRTRARTPRLADTQRQTKHIQHSHIAPRTHERRLEQVRANTNPAFNLWNWWCETFTDTTGNLIISLNGTFKINGGHHSNTLLVLRGTVYCFLTIFRMLLHTKSCPDDIPETDFS